MGKGIVVQKIKQSETQMELKPIEAWTKIYLLATERERDTTPNGC